MKIQSRLKKFRREKSTKKNILNVRVDNFEYEKKYKDMTSKKKHVKLKKVLLIILCVILSLLLIFGSVFAYLYHSGKIQFKNPEHEVVIPADKVQDNGNTVETDGTVYVYDEDVMTILLMGIDKDEKTQIKTDEHGTAGQADAIFLACIDLEEHKYTILSINRDSMIDVDVYDTSGNYVGIKKMQACLSFAYGDGKKKSCENTSKAISRMLFNIPINSYFSINKASIALLNDIIGGVDVPVYDANGNLTGDYTYLDGKAAYSYIHDRDTEVLDSNLTRMKRQKSYIKAFASKVIERTKSDYSIPLELFETISIYSTTDLNASKITYLTTNAFASKKDIKINFKNVPGKVVEGKDGYAEYEIDTTGLTKVVLDIFYDKAEDNTPTETTTK